LERYRANSGPWPQTLPQTAGPIIVTDFILGIVKNPGKQEKQNPFRKRFRRKIRSGLPDYNCFRKTAKAIFVKIPQNTPPCGRGNSLEYIKFIWAEVMLHHTLIAIET